MAIEGLDGTGKSTLAETAAERLGAQVLHSPSGGGAIGESIYKLTENRHVTMTAMARQMLHLAAHAEAYHNTIIPALNTSSLIMDRNWVSTFAYGMAGGLLEAYDLEPDEWYEVVQLPTMGEKPDAVILMLNPHVDDDHNTAALEEAYLEVKRMLQEDVELGYVGEIGKASRSQQLIAFIQHMQMAGLTEEL